MNSKCEEFVDYIVNNAPQHNKKVVEDDVCAHFNLIKDRKVYHNEYFAVRFCYSKFAADSFSNTVLSLSVLEKYDKIPFFCCTRSSAINKLGIAFEYNLLEED